MPWDTMSNSTRLSYLAKLLLEHMPDRTERRQRATVELISNVLETDGTTDRDQRLSLGLGRRDKKLGKGKI